MSGRGATGATRPLIGGGLTAIDTATEALAAVLGGTQSLHTNSLDEVLALPSEEAVEIALRTQQVIAYESGVTRPGAARARAAGCRTGRSCGGPRRRCTPPWRRTRVAQLHERIVHERMIDEVQRHGGGDRDKEEEEGGDDREERHETRFRDANSG